MDTRTPGQPATEQEAYEAGAAAYRDGKSRAAAIALPPGVRGRVSLRAAWLRGWDDACSPWASIRKGNSPFPGSTKP